MTNDLFNNVMRRGARLVFTLAVILFIVQVIDAALGILTVLRMRDQGNPYGDYVQWLNLIAKILSAFAWPVLLIGLAMVIDRLDGRESGRK